jgi:DNA adenine methylase
MARTLVNWSPDRFAPDIWQEESFQAGALAEPAIRPFIKWVGGKRGLLGQLEPLLPIRYGVYHEPFAGSAALFFAMRPERAHLADLNRHLMTTYRVVRDDPDALLRALRKLERNHGPEQYYRVREAFNSGRQVRPVLRAARFIYLNKTCFNGLWRVNRKGHFNVPAGRYKNPKIYAPELIAGASEVLCRAELRHGTYGDTTDVVQPGDFVYLDPPYVPVSSSASFTSYQAGGFGPEDQLQLRDVFAHLDALGAQVMLSNSDTPEVWELYRGFRIERIWARRSVNSKSDRRGPISELVVRNFYLDRRGAERVHERLATAGGESPAKVRILHPAASR